MQKHVLKIAKGILFLLWAGVVAYAVWYYFRAGIALSEYPILLREWIGGFGIWGPLVYIIVYTVRPLIFFPGTLLTTAAGVIFGPLYGLLYTLIGANLSAATSFWVGRYFGRGFFAKLSENPKLKIFDCSLRENGFLAILIMRLVFLPFDVVGYLAGACGFRYRDFAVGTLVGIIPGTATFVLLGSGFSDPRNLIFSAIAFVVGIVIARILKKKDPLAKLKQKT